MPPTHVKEENGDDKGKKVWKFRALLLAYDRYLVMSISSP